MKDIAVRAADIRPGDEIRIRTSPRATSPVNTVLIYRDRVFVRLDDVGERIRYYRPDQLVGVWRG